MLYLKIPEKTMIRTHTAWKYNPMTDAHDIAFGVATTINPDGKHVYFECEGTDTEDARKRMEALIDIENLK